ncbi:hypothetical protein AgCh_023101 [Apium graveolens]
MFEIKVNRKVQLQKVIWQKNVSHSVQEFLTGEGETEDTMSHSARNASLEYHIGTKKNQDGKVFKLKHADWKASHQYILFNFVNNEIESLIREHRVSLDGEATSKRFKRENPVVGNVNYYGSVEEIFELDYWGVFNVVLFKYCWYQEEKDKYGLTKKLSRDVCDAENENATEEEIKTSTLDDIDIDQGLEFENSLLVSALWSVLTVVGSSDDEKHTMDDTTVNVRLHYKGKLKKTSYIGEKHFIVMGLDVESFSYSVLMELVKDNLHFTEIGGIYANKGKKGGSQLLSNDKQVMALVEDCAPGYLVNFYIDNIVDKQIEPAPQMQPHVITRPRENFIEETAEAKNEKVTARRKLALEPCAGDTEDTGNKDLVEKLPPPPPLSEYLKFKKAGCRGDSEDTRIDVAEKLPPPPPLCEYEKLKLDKMRANNEVYKSLGLPQIVSTFKDAVESSSKSKGKIGKETTIEEDDSQYVLANEGDVESDDLSEDIESVKQKKIDVGPKTGSRGNAAPRKYGTATERAATRAYCPQPIKPTSTKIFRQSSNDGPAPGTVAAYFALRDRQMNNDEAPMNENVVEFEMEQNADEEV